MLGPSPTIDATSESLKDFPCFASSRCRSPRCVPKSTPRPKNSTRNATEIRLSFPIVTAASPVVQIDPTTVRLGGAAPIANFTRRVNRDGFLDETFVFRGTDIKLPPGFTTATVSGEIDNGPNGAAEPFSTSIEMLLVLRALFGIGMGGEWGLGASLALETIPAKARGCPSKFYFDGSPPALQGRHPAFLFLAPGPGSRFARPGWESKLTSPVPFTRVHAMLSREENERLTRVGKGTPMGELMRRYWIPAVFTREIATPDGPPVRVKLLGERLVAFRDTKGRVGLVAEACPHRTASLFFGRNEECGLRCVYHGWKFDIEGRCVDMPSEPEGSTFMNKVHIDAYPCEEHGGVVWTYMGPAAQKPEFPALEWAHLPASQAYVTRHIQECNWLQGLEGGFDSSHLSFLHGGSARTEMRVVPTRYEVVPTDFGFVAGSGREEAAGETFWTANVTSSISESAMP